ncbi:hypothetical protein [Microbacterium paraoxydans]|uniref:hypothetical protein n=1 Tax=Microbacterium paraoxydans TaxID=199592 RepID=UPI003D71B156
MAQKPSPRNPAKPVDPQQLNHADFRWFILHVPTLAHKGIRRTSWVAIGLALAQYGDYRTGERVNPSKKLLHKQTGAHNDTITKVIDVLKANGALQATGRHQGVNGGQPYEVFSFRRSPAVEKVLSKRDAYDWHERASVGPEPGSTSPEPASVSPEPASVSPEDNRNITNVMNESNVSVEDSPSPAPVVAQPSARDGAADELDEKLSVIGFNDDPYADILANL